MKTLKISLLALLASLAFYSCKKEVQTAACPEVDNTPPPDTTPPTITLIGLNPVTIAVGDPYVDAGAIAIDDNGDTLTVVTNTTAVNTATVGTYTVNYSATDVAGNVATADRTVNVEIQEKNWEGAWHVVHDVTTGGIFPTDLLASPCDINGFGGVYSFNHGTSGNKITEGIASGQNITMQPSDITVNDILITSSTYTLEGTGAINNEGDEIIINYTITNCTGCLSTPSGGTATYSKQ